MPLSSDRALFLLSEVFAMEAEGYTIVSRQMLSCLARKGVSGTDFTVLMALMHREPGDVDSVGGYCMSAAEISRYMGGRISNDSVRRSLSRLVSKGVLKRSGRMKFDNCWRSVYTLVCPNHT
jgi:predicted transcriptional regulator